MTCLLCIGLGRWVLGNLYRKSLEYLRLQKSKKLVHSCKKVCVYSKSSTVEFLVGTSTYPVLNQEVKECEKQQTQVFLLFRFLIIVSTKGKPHCKTIFNNSSHWFRINFSKCWIFNKILSKTTICHNVIKGVDSKKRFSRTPHEYFFK